MVAKINEKNFMNIENNLEPDPINIPSSEYVDTNPHGQQSIGLDVSFLQTTPIYGIPEHADFLALSDTTEPYRLYNLDIPSSKLYSKQSYYGVVPFIFNDSFGFYWLNASDTYVDVQTTKTSKDVVWTSEVGPIEFTCYVCTEITPTFTISTGRPAMPPLWALGYHQCRWNYESAKDLLNVNDNLNRFEIPCDVVWLDIEHTDGKRYFTWDLEEFPDPQGLQLALEKSGRKLVNIVDPHIKADEDYWLYSQIKSKDLMVQNSSGETFFGHCWPGTSIWPDFSNPQMSELWAEQFTYQNYKLSRSNLFVWNDMNEPSVFSGPEITMPKDCIHTGCIEHRAIHNLYGQQHHIATYRGLNKRDPDTRPFILTRSFFAGSQQYAAVWTGDNAATWEDLRISVPMCLSLSMCGIGFVGADVGGFFENPSGELLVRWYQLGAFLPFFRGHSMIETRRREPWLFGEPVQSYIRAAIQSRYRLLPYIYTLFYEYHTLARPVVRPVWLEFPGTDPTEDLRFMLGPSIFVVPISQQGQVSVDLQLPEGLWYNLHTYMPQESTEISTRPDQIPAFIRGGSVLAIRETAQRSTAFASADPYTLVVAPDSQGNACGSVYIDDTCSNQFTKGEYLFAELSLKGNKLSNIIKNSMGNFECRIARIYTLGKFDNPLKQSWGSIIDNLDLRFDQEWTIDV